MRWSAKWIMPAYLLVPLAFLWYLHQIPAARLQLLQLGIKVGQTKIDPDQNGQGWLRGVRMSQKSFLETKKGCTNSPLGVTWKGQASPPSAEAKLTARPGTMVEMACL